MFVTIDKIKKDHEKCTTQINTMKEKISKLNTELSKIKGVIVSKPLPQPSSEEEKKDDFRAKCKDIWEID